MRLNYVDYNTEAGRMAVLGVVANWGKIEEWTEGYKAARSYPLRLWVPYACWRMVGPLEDAYGVPVGLRNLFKDAAFQMGNPFEDPFEETEPRKEKAWR